VEELGYAAPEDMVTQAIEVGVPVPIELVESAALVLQLLLDPREGVEELRPPTTSDREEPEAQGEKAEAKTLRRGFHLASASRHRGRRVAGMLRLPPEQRALLEAWSRDAYPREACGVLVGERTGEDVHVRGVVRGRNLEERRPEARFELDPVTIVTAAAAARAHDHDVVGIWHSHPDGPASLSQRDRRGVWSGWSQVVIGVQRDGTTAVSS
jgi:proteasome lid subunit RPN8/RPN11